MRNDEEVLFAANNAKSFIHGGPEERFDLLIELLLEIRRKLDK